jgi:hypothetical protein
MRCEERRLVGLKLVPDPLHVPSQGIVVEPEPPDLVDIRDLGFRIPLVGLCPVLAIRTGVAIRWPVGRLDPRRSRRIRRRNPDDVLRLCPLELAFALRALAAQETVCVAREDDGSLRIGLRLARFHGDLSWQPAACRLLEPMPAVRADLDLGVDVLATIGALLGDAESPLVLLDVVFPRPPDQSHVYLPVV